MLLRTLALIGLLTASSALIAGNSDWLGKAPAKAGEVTHDVAEIASAPERWLDQTVTVSGDITEVCTNRGCWAVFASGGEMLRIIARDHGFALPHDFRGPAIAYGVIKRHELSEDAARHMVEDDGADPKLLADPVEYRLIADGVRLLGP